MQRNHTFRLSDVKKKVREKVSKISAQMSKDFELSGICWKRRNSSLKSGPSYKFVPKRRKTEDESDNEI